MFFKKKKKYEFLPLEATTREGKKKLKLAEKLEQEGKFREAADLYREISMFAEAKELYKQAGAFKELAQLLLEEGDRVGAAAYFEKAGDISTAARLYEEAGKPALAAPLYKQMGDILKAASLYEMAGDYEEAGDLYFKGKNYQKAIEAFERSGKALIMAETIKSYINSLIKEGEISGDILENLQNLARRGADIFEKNGKLDEARKLYIFAGDYIGAARCLEALGDTRKAVDMYLRGGDKEKAVQLLEKINAIKESAKLKGELYLEKGQLLEAVKSFMRAEEFLKAAVIWEKLGKSVNAAEMYFKGGEYRKAGYLFAKSGDYRRAAESFERAGDTGKAIEYFKKAGDLQKVIHLLEKEKRFFEVGELYLKKGLNDKAIKAFQKVPPGDPRFRNATFHLARIFEEKGMYNLAVEKYLELKEMRGETNEFYAEIYYRLGDLEEKLGNFSRAIEYFEKVNGYLFDYKDVSVRLQQLREKEREKLKAQMQPEVDVNAQTMVIPRKEERYRIIEEIGKGGMGIVYKAEDTLLGRIVALKKLPPQFQRDEKAIARFVKEAKSAAILNHPNIVTLYDFGYEKDGSIYIAMEYVEGKTLKQILNEAGPFPVNAVILIFGQIAKGLGYAHKRGIVHRDIKPSNIMWTKEKEIKIMDFGLAAAMEELQGGVTTVVGTPYYMSPEQALGDPVDQRSDIYSLGITIFELLVGFPPFKEGDIGYHHIHTPPPPPSRFKPEIPEKLEKIILKCLAKSPDERYNNTQEIIEELKGIVK